jgi:hypothetical protein
MTGATKVQEFGFSPEQLTLKDLRRIPEERVTAVLGTPAVVVGLGAGLDRSTFTNYTEAREAAYEQAIIPPQALLAEEIWFQLLPDFEPPSRSGRGGSASTCRSSACCRRTASTSRSASTSASAAAGCASRKAAVRKGCRSPTRTRSICGR